MARCLYQELSSLVDARVYCSTHKRNDENGAESDSWFNRHTDRIERLVRNHMPSGSGFDSGTTIDLDKSHAGKLVFNTAFHHKDESGGYDGWTEHQVTVTPSFPGYNIRIGGRDRNEIKDYVHECFDSALCIDLEPEIIRERFGMTYKPNWDKDGCRIVEWVLSEPGKVDTHFPSMAEMDAWIVAEYRGKFPERVSVGPNVGPISTDSTEVGQ